MECNSTQTTGDIFWHSILILCETGDMQLHIKMPEVTYLNLKFLINFSHLTLSLFEMFTKQ